MLAQRVVPRPTEWGFRLISCSNKNYKAAGLYSRTKTKVSSGKRTFCFAGENVPFHHHGQSLVGALHQTDGLLSVAAQGNLIDVDQLVPHLETHHRCLAALLHLEKHNTTGVQLQQVTYCTGDILHR